MKIKRIQNIYTCNLDVLKLILVVEKVGVDFEYLTIFCVMAFFPKPRHVKIVESSL